MPELTQRIDEILSRANSDALLGAYYSNIQLKDAFASPTNALLIEIEDTLRSAGKEVCRNVKELFYDRVHGLAFGEIFIRSEDRDAVNWLCKDPTLFGGNSSSDHLQEVICLIECSDETKPSMIWAFPGLGQRIQNLIETKLMQRLESDPYNVQLSESIQKAKLLRQTFWNFEETVRQILQEAQQSATLRDSEPSSGTDITALLSMLNE
ncbi:hypothetical protein [Leptolyngbya ohadii]|uniref:hypothetical protein n=1 Tax=Leptolyngbya ohadii TaxID=1962290 RepID=UPI000B59AE7B|nr:hypothetical protein [Leptolyngbya ohadii]